MTTIKFDDYLEE